MICLGLPLWVPAHGGHMHRLDVNYDYSLGNISDAD